MVCFVILVWGLELGALHILGKCSSYILSTEDLTTCSFIFQLYLFKKPLNPEFFPPLNVHAWEGEKEEEMICTCTCICTCGGQGLISDIFTFVSVYVFETGFLISLCSNGCSGTHSIDQADLELIESLLSLPLECWG